MQEIINFLTVLVVAVGIAGGLGALYASGLRLWAQGGLDSKRQCTYINRLCSVICFTACVVIILFALWLMIPMFH